jgi:hypothetical protein
LRIVDDVNLSWRGSDNSTLVSASNPNGYT